jgi:glucokinase
MLPAMSDTALAVDIGGTKVAAGLVRSDGTLVAARRCPTPRGDAEEVYAAVRGVVGDVMSLAASEGLAAASTVGVGCGGPMGPRGELVSPLNIPGWRDFPLRRRLSEELGLPVFVDNDAKALALGEGWVGGASGVDDFMAMVVSTGVGGGVVLDGRLLHGRCGNAGHIGHVVVEPEGADCACGGRGCLEAEISGPSIARRTGGDPQDAPIDERRRAGVLLGRAVASVANLLDLELVLVGGSVALGFGRVFFDAAQQELSRRSRLDFSRGATVRPVGLGADGPLVGAAAVGFAGMDTVARKDTVAGVVR